MKISDSSQAEVPCTSSSESHVAQIPASEKESECCAPLCSPTGTHRDSLTPITPPPDLHIEKTSANLAGYLTLPTVTYEPNGSPTESTTPTYYSSSPNHKHGSHDNNPLPTCNYPERQSWRLASSFFLFFVCGWGDGVTGAMLPHFQTDLHLTYTTSSILFIASSAGFTVGTLLLERVLHFMGRIHMPDVGNNHVSILSLRFQRRKSRLSHSLHIADSHSPSRARSIVLIIFSVCHATFFILMGTKSYPALIAAYAVAAFSRAFLTGQVNAYVAATPKRPLGQLHGCWGFGAFAAPLVCQSILAKGVPWTNFYFGSLVLSAINTALLTYSFRPTSLERAIDNLAATHCRDSNLSDSASSPITESEKGANCETLDAPKSRTLKLALTSPYVWAFSIFAWIYSGGETVTAGYIVTYVLHVRHANPQTAGYVSSGFWAGITISRVTYGFLSPKLNFTQRKHLVHVFLGISLAMHLMIWFVNSNIENAFSAGIVGLVYGPIFPSLLALATEVLPKEVHLITMAIISAFACLGASLLPFMTGAISNVAGPQVVTYITVALSGVMTITWFMFPSRPPVPFNYGV